MTHLPNDELDPQIDGILDQAIFELREVAVPAMPSNEFPTTCTPPLQRRSLARSWGIIAALFTLAVTGSLVWLTDNRWPLNQPAIVVPPVTQKSKQVLPALEREAAQLERVVQESILPLGLVSRSEIQMVSIDSHSAKAILTDLNHLQFEIDQLAEHMRRVEIDDRTQKLLDELHRMVTTTDCATRR